MNRRSFISNLAYASGGAFLAFSGLNSRAELLANTNSSAALKAYGFGSLSPTAAKNTGETYLALPQGFEYNVLGKTGKVLSDGRPTPPAHDGMATFQIDGKIRIVRNHEVAGGKTPRENFAIGNNNHYDDTAGGGTTTLVINPKTNEIERDFVSLSGTLINCAGGRTPWGSWISCEETTLGQTIIPQANGTKIGGFKKPHGYCFEVPAKSNVTIAPVPLKAMGRFTHEAIAVDIKSGIVYLTEDYGAAGFYRFLPNRKGRLAEGGKLQMLAIKDKPNYDTRTAQTPRATFTANWVTIDTPDPAEADVDPSAVYKQGKAKGAATFARLEGCYAGEKGGAYFVSTNGGGTKGGQIWFYEPINNDEGRLTMLFETPDRELLDMPDNICLHSKSDLLFICEDSDYVGQGGTPDNYVRILTPSGKIADFAKNISAAHPSSEFAGSTFSKDGKTLFVNIQAAGVTVAIWGDWSRFKG